jgi:inorganic pyrophosphatase
LAQNRKGLLHYETFYEGTKDLAVVVETPKGSRNKYRYHEELELFVLDKVLPSGFFFPFDFGFLPSTLAADGDPLDVVLFMDESAAIGCIIKARLIGVIEAEQSDKKKRNIFNRNDRLLGICTESHEYKEIKSMHDLSPTILDQVEYFFTAYHRYKGVEFRPLGRYDARRARKIIEEGRKAFQQKNRATKSRKETKT